MEFWNLSQVPDSSTSSYEVQTSRLLSPIFQGQGHLDASLTYLTGASGPTKVHPTHVCILLVHCLAETIRMTLSLRFADHLIDACNIRCSSLCKKLMFVVR